MIRMAIITKSYAPDYELCADLNRSVLAHSSNNVDHHILVPRSDLKLFAPLAGTRTHVRCESEFVPRSFFALPFRNYAVNVRRPLPPVRGWILQQIIKLAAAASADADLVLLVDSDTEFVRTVKPESFKKDGVVRFYRKPNEIDHRLPRHVAWHQVSRRLIGLPDADPPYPDYISSLVAWDPAIVRKLLSQIEHIGARAWPDIIGACLHFSECILYGVFVDEFLGAPTNSHASDRSLCHAYWDRVPLSRAAAQDFVAELAKDDIAIMISAKSGTSLSVRRGALAGGVRSAESR